MKFFKKMALTSLVLAAGMVGLGGCRSNVKVPITFVAVTSSEYDASVQFGDYNYKFKGRVKQGSNKFVLEGKVQERVAASSGGQQGGPRMALTRGPGGGDQPGGPGGQPQETVEITGVNMTLPKGTIFVNESVSAQLSYTPENTTQKEFTWTSSDEKIAKVNNGTITGVAPGTAKITAVNKANEAVKAEATITVELEDLAAHDFSMNVSWELKSIKDYYGYVLTFDDQNKTVIHADFNKTEGRHEFFYNLTVNGQTSLVKFQAKDSSFKDRLPKNFKKWDEADSAYIFYARATGNNGSAATAYMYLHETGNEVILNKPKNRSTERELVFGDTWSLENGVPVIHSGDKNYVGMKTVEGAEHQGMMIEYDGSAYIYSANKDVKWKKLIAADFYGATAAEFVGSYTTSGPDGGEQAVQVNLGQDGKAYVFVGGSLVPTQKGTWSETAGIYTIDLGEDGVVVSEVGLDGKKQVTVTFVVASQNCCTGETEYTYYHATCSQTK